MQNNAPQTASSELLCYFYSTNHRCRTKCKINNRHFSLTRFSPDTSLTFGQFPDISLTAIKFEFSSFSRQVVTLLVLAYWHCNQNKITASGRYDINQSTNKLLYTALK